MVWGQGTNSFSMVGGCSEANSTHGRLFHAVTTWNVSELVASFRSRFETRRAILNYTG